MVLSSTAEENVITGKPGTQRLRIGVTLHPVTFLTSPQENMNLIRSKRECAGIWKI